MNGVRTIEEAQAFADQYGLGDVTGLMDRVTNAQIQSFLLGSLTQDENGNPTLDITADEMRAQFPGLANKTDEEINEILGKFGEGGSVDYDSLDEAMKPVIEGLDEALGTYEDNTFFDETGAALTAAGVTTVAAALAFKFVPGLSLSFIPIVGALAATVGAGFIGSNFVIGQEDINNLVDDLSKNDFFKSDNNMNGLFNAEMPLRIQQPNRTGGQTQSGYGLLNDKYRLNGVEVPGYQILVLAASMKEKGVLDKYPALKRTASEIYDSMPTLGFEEIIGYGTGNDMNLAFSLYSKVVGD